MKKRKNTFGFTLFELLVAISIIGILVSIGMASYSAAQKRARDARRKEDLKTLQTALEQYYSVAGAYPNPCYDGESGALGSGDSTFLDSFPVDPKNSGDHVYSPVGDCAGGTQYVYRAKMEVEGTGNAFSNCTQSPPEGEESKNYFCVKNLQ